MKILTPMVCYQSKLGIKTHYIYVTSNCVASPALIRMGDLLYEEQNDFFSAAEMYKQAALRNEPQVRFFNIWNLAVCASIHISVCLSNRYCNLYCSSTGVVRPWPPCWTGLQAATVTVDWAGPFRSVPGWEKSTSECLVQKVCSNSMFMYIIWATAAFWINYI